MVNLSRNSLGEVNRKLAKPYRHTALCIAWEKYNKWLGTTDRGPGEGMSYSLANLPGHESVHKGHWTRDVMIHSRYIITHDIGGLGH